MWRRCAPSCSTRGSQFSSRPEGLKIGVRGGIGRLAEQFEDRGVFERQLLVDDAKLRTLAPGKAQHFSKVVERDGAPQVVLEIDEIGGATGENFLA